jgi:hypothetical protein
LTHDPLSPAAAVAAPGETYLRDTPVLRSHTGTQPDLFVRWNAVPPDAASIDVVVHLHGFSQSGAAMTLSEKVARSGLDLSRRARPTVALLPRGNWLRHTWYDFPALLAGGLDRLIEEGLDRFAAAHTASRRVNLGVDRLVLTAHSGGVMPAVEALVGARRAPDELHLFDGLYGRDPTAGGVYGGIEAIAAWLDARMAHEPIRPGALRVVYIEQQTGRFSRRLGELIVRHIAAAAPAIAAELSRRYRVERSAVQHARIAERCGPDLLADPGVEFDWSR